MTPRKYMVGLAATVLLSIAFYTWLLHSVLKVPTVWTLVVMGGTTAVLVPAAAYGYKMWLVRNARIPLSGQTASARGLLHLVLFLWSLAIPAWGSAYLLWRGARLPALLVGVVAAALALYGLTRLPTFSTVQQSLPSKNVGSSALELVPGLRPFIIGLNALFLIALGILLVVQGDFRTGAAILAVSMLLTPWVVLRLRKELRRDR